MLPKLLMLISGHLIVAKVFLSNTEGIYHLLSFLFAPTIDKRNLCPDFLQVMILEVKSRKKPY